VAREPIEASTVPALDDRGLHPRSVDLRVFSAAAPEPRVLPAPLTRFAAATEGGGTKDTWLLG
jgi:uncharacterized circularly permuted ATP-grasp superfamily protein